MFEPSDRMERTMEATMEQPHLTLQVAVVAPPMLRGPVGAQIARLPGVTLGDGGADVLVVIGAEGVDRLQAQPATERAVPVVYLGSARPEDLSRASALGAQVFIGVEDEEPALEVGLRTARVGGCYWAPSLAHLQGVTALAPAPSSPPPDSSPTPRERVRSLTDAELVPAQGRARGLTRYRIARALDLSEETVKSHLHAVYAKLGVQGKRDLPAWRELLEAEGRTRRLVWEAVVERRGGNREA